MLFFSIFCLFMHSIQLVEPSWWMDVLNWWIDFQSKNGWISNLAPVFADAFVIIYPVFLIVIYIYAILKKKPLMKQWALYVFLSTFIAVLINIWIQCFFYKERPIVFFSHVDAWETLLHEILPVSSFPSDHAVVSMSFAMATLLWWLYSKKKVFTWSWILLLIVSLVMTSCRILTLVHWPSDIVAWIVLWILIPLLLMIRPIRYTLLRYIIDPIIRFEKYIIKKIFKYEQ